jgi:hypothetical protein
MYSSDLKQNARARKRCLLNVINVSHLNCKLFKLNSGWCKVPGAVLFKLNSGWCKVTGAVHVHKRTRGPQL